MKKSLKKNYIYNMSYQILIIILPIITTPYLSRVLGADGIGVYSYTISIVTYFILLGSLGLNLYGQREMAYVQDDREKRNKIFSEIFYLKTICMIISLILFYITLCHGNEYSSYYKILILEIIANIIDISWLYQGLEEFKKITIRNFIIKIISVIMIFLLVKTKNDVGLYLFIYSLSTFLGNLLLWYKSKNHVSLQIKNLNIKKHIKPSIILFIPQIAIQIYAVLDRTMIGFILDDMSEVGYYEQAQKIIKLLLTVVSSVSTIMMPRIAKCYADGNKKQIKKYMYKTFDFIFMFSIPIMFGIMVVANNFVPFFFGKGYDSVIYLMIVMSPITLFISLSNVIGNQYLLSVKKQKEYTISVIAGAIINVLLNLILIIKLKAMGACIATVFAELSVTLIQFYYIKNEFSIKEIIIKSKNYFIAGIVMIIGCLLVNLLSFSNIILFCIKAIIGSILYFITLLIIKDKFFVESISIIKRIFKRKKGV